MLHKAQEGVQGGTLAGVSPFFFTFVRVRRYVGRWSLPPAAIRPHFFGACPKKRCRAAKEKRFLPWRLHHSRERYKSVDGTFLARLWGGLGACLWLSTCAPFSWVDVSSPCCQFHPISLLLRKETGWSPKETRLWVPPRGLLGPARLSHGLEAPTSPPTASS